MVTMTKTNRFLSWPNTAQKLNFDLDEYVKIVQLQNPMVKFLLDCNREKAFLPTTINPYKHRAAGGRHLQQIFPALSSSQQSYPLQYCTRRAIPVYQPWYFMRKVQIFNQVALLRNTTTRRLQHYLLPSVVFKVKTSHIHLMLLLLKQLFCKQKKRKSRVRFSKRKHNLKN